MVNIIITTNGYKSYFGIKFNQLIYRINSCPPLRAAQRVQLVITPEHGAQVFTNDNEQLFGAPQSQYFYSRYSIEMN